MKITPGTSGLAQDVKSRAKSIAKEGKVVKFVQMTTCSHNEY